MHIVCYAYGIYEIFPGGGPTWCMPAAMYSEWVIIVVCMKI